MSDAPASGSKKIIEGMFYHLAKINLAIHRPAKVVVVGSVGKTSTKIALAQLLQTEYKVSYMDDSYNDGVGLYLSVFQLKVPTNTNPISWFVLLLRAIWRTISRHYPIIVLEYGISKPGDMDNMLRLAKPEVTVLTAVTPEHMEYLKTIDIVAEEEIKAVKAASEFAVVNASDTDKKYLSDIEVPLSLYGDREDFDASFKVVKIDAEGSIADFNIGGQEIKGLPVRFVSDALIRQLTGAALAARRLGVSISSIKKELPKIRPVPGRMQLFEGKHDSIVLDDTANFSPAAGVVAIDTLQKLPVKRKVAILGNMHELGEYADEGYEEVSKVLSKLDVLILVGELSGQYFGEAARKLGFKEDKNLFYFGNSIDAGNYVAENILKKGDGVLVKGPFGGFYLEEATKQLLKNDSDKKYLTRQSDFWHRKKRSHFGGLFVS